MAVLGIDRPDKNGEVSCPSCNEVIWRIFAFPIHEHHSTVLHLVELSELHGHNQQRQLVSSAPAQATRS